MDLLPPPPAPPQPRSALGAPWPLQIRGSMHRPLTPPIYQQSHAKEQSPVCRRGSSQSLSRLCTRTRTHTHSVPSRTLRYTRPGSPDPGTHAHTHTPALLEGGGPGETILSGILRSGVRPRALTPGHPGSLHPDPRRPGSRPVWANRVGASSVSSGCVMPTSALTVPPRGTSARLICAQGTRPLPPHQRAGWPC